MKQIFTIIGFLAFYTTIYSQSIVAITVTGDTVLLNENGTWEYKGKHSSKSTLEEIPFSNTKYSKPDNATKMQVGGKGVYEIWYDPKFWTKVSASKQSKDADLAFEMTGQLAYSIVIYEKVEIPVETLLNIAYDNTKGSATNMKIVMKEYRVVNGNKVALMQMEGEVDGLKVTYYSYYFSSDKGTWQVHTYCMTAFFKQYKGKMEDLLNGFIVK